MPRRRPRLFCALGLVLVLAGNAPQAEASPAASAVVPVPVPGDMALPAWMERPTASVEPQITTLHIPIIPPADAGALAVTVYFIEPQAGFLRALWTGAFDSTMLAINLYEGAALPNKKTILIPRSLLAGPGILSLQCNGEASTVYQLGLEWVTAQEVLRTDGAEVAGLYRADDTGVAEAELRGEPYRPSSDRWEQDVITAPLTDRIERIDSGVDFIAALESAPGQARLSVWLAGPAMDTEIRLELNGTDAGPVALEVPDLSDDGYYLDENGGWHYAGWRKGTISLPAALLAAGDNTIHFRQINPGAGDAGPLAVKDMLIQLRYPPGNGLAAPEPDEPDNPLFQELPHGPLGPQYRFLMTEPALLPD